MYEGGTHKKSQVVHGLALWQALKHLPVAGPLKEAKGCPSLYELFDPVYGLAMLIRRG
jgi:hypothetical protein